MLTRRESDGESEIQIRGIASTDIRMHELGTTACRQPYLPRASLAASLMLEVIGELGNETGQVLAAAPGLGLVSVASKLGKRAKSWNPGQTILSPDSGLWRMQFRTVHRASGHIRPLRVHSILD
jgi:hypothetical protein